MLGIILLMMNMGVVLIGVGLACLAFPKVRMLFKEKESVKEKKTEMTTIANPLHRRNSSKGGSLEG